MSATFPETAADSPSLEDPAVLARERAAHWQYLQELSPLNRFRIMYGRPLVPEPAPAFQPPPHSPPQAWQQYPDKIGFWWCWDAEAESMSCIPVDARNLRVYLHHQEHGILSHPAGDYSFTPAPAPPPPPGRRPQEPPTEAEFRALTSDL